MSESSLWTISVQGGRPFSFHVGGNPDFDHDGGNSVQHLVITEAEAASIRGLGVLHGCRTKVFQMLGQNAEQDRVKARLDLGAGRIWPTPKCPQCPWLDPRYEGDPCGLVSEDPTVVESLLESSEPRRQAAVSCPR